MSDIDDNGTVPPIGEEIHMPAPSILPLANAAALALAIVCVTLSWWLVALFGFVFRGDDDSLGRRHAPRHRAAPAGSQQSLVA